MGILSSWTSFMDDPHHIILRPYWVCGCTYVLLLSVFLLFVLIGWPGGPIGCIYEEPHDGCYCEAFDLEDVEEGKPGVRQPVNTWFNLFVIIPSSFVAWRMSQDRKQLFGKDFPESTTEQDEDGEEPRNEGTTSVGGDEATEIDLTVTSTATSFREEGTTVTCATVAKLNNVMLSDNLIADWYVLTTVFNGLGKMFFHGSLTRWGTYVDGVSSNFFFAFIPWYTIRRVHHSDQVFWLGYFGTIVVISCAQIIFGSLLAVYVLMLTYCFMELYILAAKGVFLGGTCRSVTTWMLAIAVMLVATFFWWGSRTGRVMCDPESFWQIHGLVWHPLSDVTMVLLYLYWRDGDDEILEERYDDYD
ncbi:expressed unknown protein [Seminavis robusta]|uniref:Uncharacterized protein n=1 Tax=Seminavis robusta TaxID=568900 RepID=A0A9N8HFU3_9STRA|nr:expressed unknown protein [Seminavis robusta]|eukprot:Sro475_g150330.1 n/a (359) ;mRNA; f:7854-8930